MRADVERLFEELDAAETSGDPDRVIDVLNELLAVVRRQGRRAAEATGLRKLGNAYQEKGLLREAHASRVAAAALVKEMGPECPPPLRMHIEGDVGRSFIEFHDWPNAEPHTREALRMASELGLEHERLVNSVNLGLILAATQRNAEAARLAETVIRDATRIPDHYVLGLQHLNLARIRIRDEYRIGDAQRHLRQALAHAEVSGDRVVRREAQQLLGDVHTVARRIHGTTDDRDQAEHFLQESLRLARAGEDFNTVSEIEVQLAQLFDDHHQPEAAVEHFRRALDALERVRDTLGYEAFQLTYFQSLQPLYDAITSFLLRHGQPGQAFLASERLRSRLLLAARADRRTEAASWPVETRAELRKVLGAYGEAVVRAGVNSGGDSPEAAEARARFARLYDEQRRYSATPDAATSAAPPSIEEVQRVLDRDEALLAYHVTDDGIVVFAADRERMHFQHLPYARERLARDVEEINGAIRDPALAEPRAALEKLFAILIAPVLSVAEAKRHWTIVPHGPLHGLPWAALRGRGRYLIEQHSLSVLPSAAFAVVLARSAATAARVAVFFGDPDPDDADLALPGARAEVERACDTLRAGPPPFLGAQATKGELLARAPSARLLHIASHHCFDHAAPLLSFLKLAGSDGADFLYVLELADLHLQAQLVTLSACDTGLSRVETGDEQYGIVRAFLAAGARSVVSTLWPIEDQSAAQLFSDFYERARRMPLARALAESQRQLRGDPAFAHPYFWAPYVLSGQWSEPLAL